MGSKSLCFCGHKYALHDIKATKKRITSKCQNCPCKEFKFIPQRPEECGMYWLPRRKEFKVSEWKAKCKCKLPHDEHKPVPPYNSKQCQGFWCDFACIACDCRWEDHLTLFEFEDERRAEGKKVGAAYFPLSTNKELQDLVFHTDRNKLPQYNRPNNPALKGPPAKAGIGYGGHQGMLMNEQQDQMPDDRFLDPSHYSNYMEEIGYQEAREQQAHPKTSMSKPITSKPTMSKPLAAKPAGYKPTTGVKTPTIVNVKKF